MSSPSAPTITNVVVGDQSMNVFFTQGDLGGGQIVSYKYSLNGSEYVTANETSSPILITGLTNGYVYNIRLIVVTDAETSNISQPSDLYESIIPYTYPSAPAIVDASAGINSISVDFTQESNGGYAIHTYSYSLDAGITYIDVSASSSPLVIADLSAGQTYTVTLKAVSYAPTNNMSSPSNTSSQVVPYEIPQPPTITSVVADISSVSVSFTEGSHLGSSIVGYKYSVDSGTTYLDASGSTSPLIIHGLTNGTTYTLTLKTVTDTYANNVSAASNTSDPFTPYEIPHPPTITSVDVSNQQLRVYFTEGSHLGSSIVGYKYSIDSEATFVDVSNTGSPLVISGLTNGTAYTVWIKVVSDSPSNNVSVSAVTATSYTPYTRPSAPIVTVDSSNQALIFNYAEGNNGGYPITNIQYKLGGVDGVDVNEVQLFPVSNPSSQFTISGDVNPIRNGTYYVTQSSFASPYHSYNLLDNDTNTLWSNDWTNNNHRYLANGNGTYSGIVSTTVENVGTVAGEWMQIQFPNTIVINSYGIQTYANIVARYPKEFYMLGSTNGTTWYVIDHRVNQSVNDFNMVNYDTPNKTISTKYIRFVIVSLQSNSSADDFNLVSLNIGVLNYINLPLTDSSFSIGGLTNGTSYTYSFREISSAPENNVSSVLTLSGTPTGQPLPPTFTIDASNQKLIVSYSPPSNNGGYPIIKYYYAVDSGEWIETPDQSGTFQITGLTNGTTYGIKMKCTSSYPLEHLATSVETASVSAIPYTNPDQPTILNVYPANNAFIVKYSNSANNGGYPISSYQYSTNGSSYTNISQYSSSFKTATAITGAWISGSLPVAAVFIVNGEKVYAGYDGLTKMATESGIQKYYAGTISEFNVNNWDSYASPGVPGAYVVNVSNPFQLVGSPVLDTNIKKMGDSSLFLNSSLNQYGTITQFTMNTSGFSLAFWIRPDMSSISQPVFLFETMGNYTTNGAISIYMDTDGSIKMTSKTNDVLSTYTLHSSISSNDGQWTHIAITINQYKRLKAYINGALTLTQATNIVLGGGVTHTSVYVGRTGSSSVRYNGHIDDFRMYNGKVLSINEITLLYNYDGTPSFSLNEDPATAVYSTFNNDTNMFSVFGLSNGSSSNIYLRAVSTAPVHKYSTADLSSSTPFSAPPSPKLDVIAGENYIDVSYGSPDSNTSGYPIVKYQYSYEDEQLVDISFGAQKPYIDGLVLGNKYDVFLHTVSSAPYNNISVSTYRNIGTHIQPLAPTITSIDASNTTLTVYYNNSLDLGGYDLSGYQYSINAGTTWNYVASSGFTISGLTNGTIYSVIMRTVTLAPDTNISLDSSAVVGIPYTKPSAPVIYNIDSSGTVLDVYYGTTNNGGYAISYYELSVDNGEYINIGTQLPYSYSGSLTVGQSYNIKVRAVSIAPLNNVSADSAVRKGYYVGTSITTPVITSADISNQAMNIYYTQDANTVPTQKYICTEDEITYREIEQTVVTGSVIVNEINLDASLSSYYTFETDSVSELTLANKASGTYVYDATMSTTGLIGSASKVVGSSSLQFASPLKWVTLPQMDLGRNGFTISFWFRHQSSPTYARIFDFDNFAMAIMSNSFYVETFFPGASWLYNSSVNINDGVWRHFTITLSSTGYFILYINGTLSHQSQRAYPANSVVVNNYLGKANVPGDNFPLNGNIDEFRIYKRVLNSTDVTKVYQYTGDIDTRQNVLQYDISSPLVVEDLLNGQSYSFKIQSVLDTSASVALSNSKFVGGTSGWTVDGSTAVVSTMSLANLRSNVGIDASNVVTVNQYGYGSTVLSQPVNVYGAGKYILKVAATSSSIYDASQTIQLGIDGNYSVPFKMLSKWKHFIHVVDIPTAISTKQLQLKVNNASTAVAAFDPASMFSESTPFSGTTSRSTGIAITNDENRALQTDNNGRVKFAVRTNGVWGAFQNTLDATTRAYRGVCVTGDGERCVVVAGDATAEYCYFATWNGSNYSTFTQTQDTTARKYSGCAMSKDGNRLVVSVLIGYIYFATWNGTNYTSFTQTLDLNNRRYIGIGCTPDAGRIVYGPDGATGYTYYADWNGTNYSNGVQTLNNTGLNSRGFAISNDMKYIYYTVQGNATATLRYATWNGSNYSTYSTSSAVPGNLDGWALALNNSNDSLYLAPFGTTTTYKVKIPYSITVNQKDAVGQLFAAKKPWAIYSAEDYNAATGTIAELRGLNSPAIITGVGVGYSSLNGNGSGVSIPQVTGTTNTIITFPTGSIPATFTICGITRYNGGSRQRIFTSQTGNWLLGHWQGGKGRAFFESWVANTGTQTNLDNWQVICGKNSGAAPNNVLADGVAIGTSSGGSGNNTLRINAGGIGEPSDFAFSHVFIWNQALTDSEMLTVSQSLSAYLQTGVSFKQYFPTGSTLGITNVSLSKAYTSALSNPTSSIIPYTAPDAPTVNTVDSSNQFLTVNYTDSTNNGGYNITKYQYTIDGGVTYIDVSLGTNTFLISNLTNGTTYNVAMRAVSSAPANNFSAKSSAKSGIPYTQPSALTITSIDPSNNKLLVNFTTANTGGYPLVRYEYSLNAATYVSATTQLSSPITISGLTNGTSYSVKLRQVTSAPINPASADSNTISEIPCTVPSAPVITAIDPSNRRLTVSYTAPASNGRPITSYKYSLNGLPTLYDASVVNPIVINTGLANATEYTVRLYAVNSVGTSVASNGVASTPFSVPNAPQITQVVPGDRTVTVTFEYPTDNGGYVVQGYKYSLNGGTTYTNYTITTPREMTINNLTNGTSYTFVIKAYNVKGESPASNSVAFTPNANPATPFITNITPRNEGATVYYTNGIGSALITGYKYSVNGGEFVDASYNANTIAVTGLINRRLYYIKVRAYNPIFDSSDSNIFPVYAGSPLKPVIVDVSAIGTDAYIHYTQEMNDSSPIQTYEVFSGATKLWSQSASVSPIVVPNMVSGRLYNIQIRAINEYGASYYSNMVQNVRFGLPPAKIQKITIIPSYSLITVRVVSVDNKNFPITAYKYSINDASFVNAGTYPIFKITGLVKDTSYNVRVVATNEIGDSIPSDRSYFILTYSQVPEVPTINRLDMPDKNTLNIFMTPPVSATPILKYKYALFRNGILDASYTETSDIQSPITITGLLPNVNYSAKLIAVNDAGDSVASNTFPVPVSFAFSVPNTPVIVGTRNVGGQMYAIIKISGTGGSPLTNIKYSYNNGTSYTNAGSTTSPLLLPNVPLNTRVSLRVILVNAAGDSAPSRVVTFTKVYREPSAPMIRRITPGKNNVIVRISASQPNGSPITGYKYSLNDGAYLNITTLLNSQFVISGLTANTDYKISIISTNAIGNSVNSLSNFRTLP
jgi:hypothetical protein